MASYQQMILEELQSQGAPMAKGDLAKAIEKTYKIKMLSTQLDSPLSKMKKANKVWQDQETLYHLGPQPGYTPPTAPEEPQTGSDPESPGTAVKSDAGTEVIDATEESIGATEYQQFMQIGEHIGYRQPLIGVVARHIWDGGNFRDLNWVWQGLCQMNLRPDLRDRWFHAWRSRLGQGIPAFMKAEAYDPIAAATAQDRPDVKKGARDYIIDEDMPVRVSEGTGDFSFEEAERVLSIRARGASKAATAVQAQPMTMKDVAEIIKLFQDKDSAGKHFVVTPTAEGTVVQEVAAGQPVIVGTTAPPPPSTKVVDSETGTIHDVPSGEPIIVVPRSQDPPSTYVVGPDGVTHEVPYGKPVIINPPAPQTQAQAATWIVNPIDGTKTKVEPGEPIIITSAPVRQDGVAPMIMQLRDQDGNPMQMDLTSLLELKRFEGEEKRASEKHSALIATLGQFRKELPVAIKAYAATANQRAATTRAQPPARAAAGEAAVESQPETLACPNPACDKPMNIAGMPAGADGECPHCHEHFTLQYPQPSGPSEEAQPSGPSEEVTE